MPRQGAWSVYVHFPWCLKRCAYCDFATSVADRIPRGEYTAAVLAELEMRTAAIQAAPVATVFFGGGTPSLWGARHVGAVLEWIDQWAGLRADAEVTLEANPGAAETGDLQDYAAAGVNRVSLGVQSLHARHLRWLDRIHDAADALAAVDRLLEFNAAGRLRSVSVDLIFGIPGQTLGQLRADVAALVDRGVPHLSAYALTVEERTPLHARMARGEVRAPSDAATVRQLMALPGLVASGGLLRYEVSNFARPGHESRHNQAYWRGDHYLAAGVGAHGFVPAPQLCGVRYANSRHSGQYIDRIAQRQLATEFEEPIDAATHATERVMTGLRTAAGLDLAALESIAGPAVVDRLVARARDRGLVGRDVVVVDGHLRLSEAAWPRLDGVVRALA